MNAKEAMELIKSIDSIDELPPDDLAGIMFALYDEIAELQGNCQKWFDLATDQKLKNEELRAELATLTARAENAEKELERQRAILADFILAEPKP
jgi:hypothetical protein